MKAKSCIEKFGYKQQDLVTLTDDQTNPRSLPTRANIVRLLQGLPTYHYLILALDSGYSVARA